MRLEYAAQPVTINLDGTEYPAVVDVVIYSEARRKFWTARGALVGQPEPAVKPDPDPASPTVALLLTKVGQELAITSQHGTGYALLAQADAWGHVDFAGTGTPPWPVPVVHVAPR